MGISPQYFLDEMSFEAMGSLLKAENEKQKRQYEKDRIGWYYSLIAPGLSKVNKATDLVVFDWEKKPKKEAKRLTKEEIKDKEIKAKKWLSNR